MVDNYFIDMKTNVNGSIFFVEKTTSVILIIYSLFKLQPFKIDEQRILLQIDYFWSPRDATKQTIVSLNQFSSINQIADENFHANMMDLCPT